MLAIDSLVIDLIFKRDVTPSPDAIVDALGGEDVASTLKILDPDMQDPRFEMELSPSMPFRRRGERRLMLIDDSVAPMRKDPRADPVVPIDLRPFKERLIALCQTGDVRLGRIFALGSWGDAVLVAEDARDLRGIGLLAWVLDPTIDVDGKKRASRLTQQEFETKLLAYDKRLEELGEKDILAELGPAKFERRDQLLVIDVLESDGTWDQRKSFELEASLASLNRFSLIPGAPGSGAEPAAEQPKAKTEAKTEAKSATKPAPEPAAPAGPPLRAAEIGDKLILIFPRERFDLDVAAALGKRDFDAVLSSQDLGGPERDRIYRDGAGFVAPLEFLSEVFVDGKPLSRGQFDSSAVEVAGGAKTLEVHCPRYGPVILIDVPDHGRFISSELHNPSEVLELLGPG